MNEKIKKIIETYQCPGCVTGGDTSCYEKGDNLECSKHGSGTLGSGIGMFYLGLPKAFCRIGFIKQESFCLYIFENIEKGWGYDKFNIPVWKHLDKHGNTLVRGLSPRINHPFLHIFIGDYLKEIDCLEITQEDIDEMD